MYIVISTCMNFSNLECHGLIGNSAWGQDDRNYLPCHMDSYAFFKPEILAIGAWVAGCLLQLSMIENMVHLHVWPLLSHLWHCQYLNCHYLIIIMHK